MGRQFYSIPPRATLDELGTYFVAGNPTPGTGLATIAAPTAYDETKAFLLLRNKEQNGQGLSIYPDYVRLVCTAAGTGGTRSQMTVVLDSDLPNTKWTSGGTELVSNSPWGPVGSGGVGQVRAGALVTIASPKPRIICNAPLRNVIPVVTDEYILHFGTQGRAPCMTGLNGTNAMKVPVFAPPVEIPGQWAMGLYLWLPSQSAASSWEVECGYWEAPSGLYSAQ